ncbi:MAG: cell division protein FtsA [Flavobacteriia bacterium]|nr:cell division protein FtsA [Flavobacteriia bacterium]
MTKIIVGLDIGTTKIACFVGRKNENGKIEILSMGRSESLGVLRGTVSNISNTIESIRKAVEDTKDNLNGDLIINSVIVGIAGHHIKSIQNRGILTRKETELEISQKDIDELIEDMYKINLNHGEEILHVLPQEYIVDNDQGIKDPIGMSGVRLEANFHIITGEVNAARNINKCVERAGLKVSQMILEPIASAEAVLSEDEKVAGVVLVDIGGGTTDIAIFHEGIIRHTAVIPFGGNVITEDIKEGFTIMKEQAEKLKVRFGSALASESQENEIVCIPSMRGLRAKEIKVKTLAKVIEARMSEIIDAVHLEIKNSGLERKLICGIVVTGGGSQLKHLNQLFEYITGMDTRIGYPTEHLAITKNSDLLASPMYSTGIGLVIKGFDDVRRKNEVNKSKGGVREGSDPERKGGFFTSIINKGKEISKNLLSDEE